LGSESKIQCAFSAKAILGSKGTSSGLGVRADPIQPPKHGRGSTSADVPVMAVSNWLVIAYTPIFPYISGDPINYTPFTSFRNPPTGKSCGS